MAKINYKNFIIVKDHFYENPQKVLKAAQIAEYYEPEHVTGRRSTSVFHAPGIKKKLEKILGIKITRWDKEPADENGVFYQGFSKGRHRETPGVHSDYPFDDITVLIYLSQAIPLDCGTSLWMHKKTELTGPPTPKDARRLKLKLSVLRNQLELDSQKRSKWTELDRIGHQFNRMVAYPSAVLHSASRHYGHSVNNGRLYQTFRIGVDWNSFKMYHY